MEGTADGLLSNKGGLNKSFAILNTAAQEGEYVLNVELDFEDIAGPSGGFGEDESVDPYLLVEEIVDRRLKKRKRYDTDVPTCPEDFYEYLVKWEDYGPEANTWQPYKNIAHYPGLLERLYEVLEEKKQSQQQQPWKKATTRREKSSRNSGRSQVGDNNNDFVHFDRYQQRNRNWKWNRPTGTTSSNTSKAPRVNPFGDVDLSDAIVDLTDRFKLLNIKEAPAVSSPSAATALQSTSPPTASNSERPQYRRLKVMGRKTPVAASDRYATIRNLI